MGMPTGCSQRGRIMMRIWDLVFEKRWISFPVTAVRCHPPRRRVSGRSWVGGILLAEMKWNINEAKKNASLGGLYDVMVKRCKCDICNCNNGFCLRSENCCNIDVWEFLPSIFRDVSKLLHDFDSSFACYMHHPSGNFRVRPILQGYSDFQLDGLPCFEFLVTKCPFAHKQHPDLKE